MLAVKRTMRNESDRERERESGGGRERDFCVFQNQCFPHVNRSKRTPKCSIM